MIQRQLKLRLNTSQESQLNTWLFQLTGVWNWAIRKIEQDAKDGIYYSQKAFHNLQSIPHTADGAIGIDPGFHTLITLSTGEKIAHPHELRQTEKRLAQAQRGGRTSLAARLQERLANQRKDRNHKLSRRLVAENQRLVWSKDRQTAIAKVFGKSVTSAGHAQLRGMLAYKCTASGREFLEVPSQYSTKTCSACGSLCGPTGYAGLSVRQWTYAACGAAHDRDVNAAINTLHAGVGTTHERCRKAVPGIPWL